MADPATATFLFTDIEGSTRLWEQHPEAMRRALERHDELLKAAVEACGGEVVKTTGDGMLAVFASAGAALAGATSAQRSVASEHWTLDGGLRVRMAMHTGAAELRDGDYFGNAVNRAARLMALAHGGQVLVSQATQLLARDGIPREIELRDLGEYRLRDLSHPERVYQLITAGLAEAFPPLRSLESGDSNLPVQLTSFVGRKAELRTIEDMVRAHRLTTIVGAGGVGKTRLALEAASELAHEFRDGVRCLELASAKDIEDLLDTAGRALGVIHQPGMTLRESILDFLGTRDMLLVLDNCEHLLDPVADLTTEALGRGLRLRVLATSRESLNISGEQIWGLRSLSLPTAGAAEEIAGAEAVQLFVDRAQATRPTFEVGATNAVSVADICRRLDGVPLAIELAAARISTMHPAEIAGHLDERFRLLSAGRRTAVERHQTLQAAVDWSYSMLSDTERVVFARLGAFPSSFDSAAAAAVAADEVIGEWTVLDALNSLVAKSMLTSEDSGATTRFGMLETLRQYARDRLSETGITEIDTRQRLHAAHFADVAEILGPQLTTSEEIAASRLVSLEIENIRSAVAWAVDRDDPDDRLLAVRIVSPLCLIVSMHRALGFGPWVERTLEPAREAPESLRFAVLGSAAFNAVLGGDIDTARRLAEEALANGPPEDPHNCSLAYTALALGNLSVDLAQAVRVLQEGADVAARGADWFSAATLRSQAGIFATLLGDVDTGRAESEAGLELADQIQNPTAMAIANYVWAATRWLDDPAGALEKLERAAALTDAGASDTVYHDTHELLARLRCEAGDRESALVEIRRALNGSVSVGARPSVSGHLWYAAEILGVFDMEPEVVGVVEGVCTRGSLATVMVAIAGRERHIHDQAIGNARTALGDAAFEGCLVRGGAMTYEQAIEFTRGSLDRILDNIWLTKG